MRCYVNDKLSRALRADSIPPTLPPRVRRSPLLKAGHASSRSQHLIDQSTLARLPATRAGSDNGSTTPVGASQTVATARTVPSDRALRLWREAEAVCFDVDCTITTSDSLDLLAEFMGVREEVEELTNKAMDGAMCLTRSLEERLSLINCSPADIKRFIAAHPPATRLAPGIKELIKTLQRRGVDVYLISGGFRELILPIAAHLGIPKSHIFANRMSWQWDDDTGMPTKLVGFDVTEPTARNQGKQEAIARIREDNPYNTVVMIGDGITDLEAVQVTGGADLFIGYGGIVERPAVVSEAEWYIYDYASITNALSRYQVAVIGSGAFASAAAKLIAENTSQDDPADEFNDEVKMYIHNDDFEGRKLTEVINETGENPKYLPGRPLGQNVRAVADLEATVSDADLLVFCVPHQYVKNVTRALMGKVKPGAAAISLTKGMRVTPEGPQLISQMIRRNLGLDCCVLMGGNIATDLADEQLSEAVIGYSNVENAERWKKLFQRPYFKINLLPDAAGAEMCGTLKNIVALASGMVDGLGLGPNSKCTIIRQGLVEIKTLTKALYPSARDDTFLECCGVGDLVATCYGGRNRLVAEAFTRAYKEGKPRSLHELEAELLKGQKLQGVLTSNEVQEIIKARRWESQFPLFTTVNRIVNGHLPPTMVVDWEAGSKVVIEEEEEDIVPIRRPASRTPSMSSKPADGVGNNVVPAAPSGAKSSDEKKAAVVVGGTASVMSRA